MVVALKVELLCALESKIFSVSKPPEPAAAPEKAAPRQ